MSPCHETATPSQPELYDPEHLRLAHHFVELLDEKQRRLFLGLEAVRLGHGGRRRLTEEFGTSFDVIRRGENELRRPELLPEKGRVRHQGGGRKCVEEQHPEVMEALEPIMEGHIAGDPMNASVRWTDLRLPEIQTELAEQGFAFSDKTVGRLVKKKYALKKPVKRVAINPCPQRNTQFEHIAQLIDTAGAEGRPVLSIDCKKKELLGSLYRDGRLWVEKGSELVRWDHDFPFLAQGRLTPFGIYDLFDNSGFMVLGEGSETPRFVADSLELWWRYRGCFDYPDAEELLVLADSGGGCSWRSHRLKEQLQRVADRLQRRIRVAHYPPGCSKWNYIEHSLFPHITRAMQGTVLESPVQVARLMERARTSTGLRVRAYHLPGDYPTGEKAAEQYFECLPAIHDIVLPHLNYTFAPRTQWDHWEELIAAN